MYRIIKDGVSVGMTATPTYIKRAENGCYVLCPELEASGFVVGETVYHLLGRPELKGVPTAFLIEVDSGTELAGAQKCAADSDAMNVDQELRLTMLELGVNNN